MNIEQIKRDWEQHCRKYGLGGYFNEEYKEFRIFDDVNGCDYNSSIGIEYDGIFSLDIDGSDGLNYKLFTVFYEKLLEPEKDNQRRCDFCDGILDEDFIVTKQGDMCSKCLDRYWLIW